MAQLPGQYAGEGREHSHYVYEPHRVQMHACRAVAGKKKQPQNPTENQTHQMLGNIILQNPLCVC